MTSTVGLATVKAGARGVDFSFAKPPAARLVELGYDFVVGYISVPPASSAKNISKTECDGYIAAGLKVLLVWEMSATRANSGATVGDVDGRNANRLAVARGYPTDVPILVADDTNTTTSTIDAHEGYVRAFAAACVPYPIGIYGDTDILARCDGLWQIGWVPNAWSWSGSSRANAEAKAKAVGAHVLQRGGFHIDNLWAVDPNDTIADFPAWGTVTELPDVTTPPPPPPLEEDDMLRKVLIPQFASAVPWWPHLACFDSGTVRPLSSGDLAPVDGVGIVTEEGHYRRLCVWAGVQLDVENPTVVAPVDVTVNVPASELPNARIETTLVWDQ